MKYKNSILTNRSAIIMFDDHDPITIPVESLVYSDLYDAIKNGQFDQVPALASKAIQIREQSGGAFDVVGGCVVIDGDPLPEALSNRISEFADQHLPIFAFLNFWYNLRENPSEDSRKDLFNFLNKNHVPLTEDGCFIAYKRVNDNLWDSYTGKTHKYEIGSVVKMPRNECDSDRNNTCSSGLHVAGYEYGSTFCFGTRLIEVKVNPKHVVAVPFDYDLQKMRVCELEVIRDCSGYMDKDVQLYKHDDVNDPDDKDELEALDSVDEEWCSDCGNHPDDCSCAEDLCLLCSETHDDCGCEADDAEDDDDKPDDDAEAEDEEKIDKPAIHRISSWLKDLYAQSDGRVTISIEVLNKIGIESGQSFCATISPRGKKIVLTVAAPLNYKTLRTVKAGTASARLPASLFKTAGLFGKFGYEVKCTHGTLEIK